MRGCYNFSVECKIIGHCHSTSFSGDFASNLMNSSLCTKFYNLIACSGTISTHHTGNTLVNIDKKLDKRGTEIRHLWRKARRKYFCEKL